MPLKSLQYYKFPILLLLSCCAMYLSFGYDLVREDFVKLVSLYVALFFLSWKFFDQARFNWKFLLGAAVLFRLLFLFSIPNLSQDFYRFIWDGKLLLQGINPYLFVPTEMASSGNIPVENGRQLIEGMGVLSAGNHSNYPPLNQLMFALSSFFSGAGVLGAVVVMRIFLIAADIGTFYFGRKLLKQLGLPENRIFWYLLNPFIIIELTGNLHFEGVMIFFLVWSFYLLHRGKWLWSAILFACAVSIKLIPLIFLPLFFRKLGWKKAAGYYAIVALTNLLLFLPFMSPDLLSTYAQTTGLWFQKFEFNAGVYYVIRWIGYEVEGYNIIEYAGKILAGIVFISVLLLAFMKRNRTTSGLLTNMLFSISIYYFLATIVHPWYLAVLVILCIFTTYRFPLVWSLLVVVSYKAYSNSDFEENMWLLALEYLTVIGFLGYEVYRNEKQKKRRLQHS